jgi:hypothetical protein
MCCGTNCGLSLTKRYGRNQKQQRHNDILLQASLLPINIGCYDSIAFQKTGYYAGGGGIRFSKFVAASSNQLRALCERRLEDLNLVVLM